MADTSVRTTAVASAVAALALLTTTPAIAGDHGQGGDRAARTTTYALPGSDVFPEGVDTFGQYFYVTSTTDGAVFRGRIGSGDVAEVYYFHLERHGDTGTPLVDADGTPTEYGRCVASFSGSAPPAPAKPSLTIKGGVKVEVSADGKRWHYTFQASALPPGTDRVLLNIAGKHQNAKGVPYVCTAANGWRALGDLRVELEWQKVVEVTAAAVDAAGTPLGGFASRLRVDGKSIKAPDAK